MSDRPATATALRGWLYRLAKRLSLGSKLATFVYGMLQTSAREMLQDGTFGFTRAGMPFGKVQELFAPKSAR